MLLEIIREHFMFWVKEWKLLTFGTEYIEQGYPNFNIIIRLKLELTLSQLREDRFKKILD